MNDIILTIIDSIMDEADSSNDDERVYTERDLSIASAWGVIAVAREIDPTLVEAILTEHPSLMPPGD